MTTLLTGALIALTFALPPGPVLVETIRRGLRGGFGPALLVQLGSIVGDLAWCAAALFGLAPLVSVAWVRLSLGVVGLAVMLWLGAQGLREALWPHARSLPLAWGASPDERQGPPHAIRGTAEAGRAFRTGIAISFFNPIAVGFWAGIGGVMAAAGIAGNSAGQTATFVGGYLAGLLLWSFAVAFGFRWLAPLLQPGGRLARLLNGVCGVCLIGLGLALGWQAFVV